MEYIAGGATQNSIRVAQWMAQTPGTCTYLGSVGTDEFAKQLEAEAKKDGVRTHYSHTAEHPTGTCACLIHDQERSLVANLSAANHYPLAHVETEESQAILAKARLFYIGGFFLTVSPPTIMHVAEHAAAQNKTLCMNLSAPFIPQFFKEPLMAALPYVDILFGNESEAQAFGEAMEYEDTASEAVAVKIANFAKKNTARPRMVVITQGSLATVVATQGSDKVEVFPVPKMDKKDIVDSNGAGDAFVGGFLSQLAQGMPIPVCVDAGHYAAQVILKSSGMVLSGTPDFKPVA